MFGQLFGELQGSLVQLFHHVAPNIFDRRNQAEQNPWLAPLCWFIECFNDTTFALYSQTVFAGENDLFPRQAGEHATELDDEMAYGILRIKLPPGHIYM